MTHWQDVPTVILGILLTISPWMIGFLAERTAAIDALATGAALSLVALSATFVARPWQAWLEFALGCWAAMSPWLLGFDDSRDPTTISVATGTLTLSLAASILLLEDHSTPDLPRR
ncbi:MAG TPA: SPW repeat protein [Burkholderiaceae bacterium]